MNLKIILFILILAIIPISNALSNEYGFVNAWFDGKNATVTGIELKVGEPVEIKVEVVSKINGHVFVELTEPGVTKAFDVINGPSNQDERIDNLNIANGWSKTFIWKIKPNGAWINGNAPINIFVKFYNIQSNDDKIIEYTIANPYILEEQYEGNNSTPIPTPTLNPTPTLTPITPTATPTVTITPTPTSTPTPTIVTSNGNVTRRISPSVIPPGSQINITLTPSPQDIFDNPGFQVVEVLPSGFRFVGTPSGYEYRNNDYTFTQIGNNPIEYTLIAPSGEGNYTISGTFKDELQNTGIVTGTIRITIGGSLISSYDVNGNGRIDRIEAVQAVMDYFSGLITRQQAIEMVMAYFSGGA